MGHARGSHATFLWVWVWVPTSWTHGILRAKPSTGSRSSRTHSILGSKPTWASGSYTWLTLWGWWTHPRSGRTLLELVHITTERTHLWRWHTLVVHVRVWVALGSVGYAGRRTPHPAGVASAGAGPLAVVTGGRNVTLGTGKSCHSAASLRKQNCSKFTIFQDDKKTKRWCRILNRVVVMPPSSQIFRFTSVKATHPEERGANSALSIFKPSHLW